MKLKVNKFIRYRGEYIRKKRAIAAITLAGVVGITIHICGIDDYLEAKSVDLVTFKDEIMYEDINNLNVIEVDNIDNGANDLYLVQVYPGIFKVKYYDVETKKRLFQINNNEIFSYQKNYEELNGNILNIESFYKYVNAVDTLKSSYTNSELMEIWEKTKEHYNDMKRIDKKKVY